MSRPRKCRSKRNPTYPYNPLHTAGIPQTPPPNDFRNFFIKTGMFSGICCCRGFGAMLNLEHILSLETKGGQLKVGGCAFSCGWSFPFQFYASLFFMFWERPKSGIWGGFMNFGSAKVKNSVKHKKVGLILGAFQELLSSCFTPKIWGKSNVTL